MVVTVSVVKTVPPAARENAAALVPRARRARTEWMAPQASRVLLVLPDATANEA
jgi:hypothetical protein